MANGLAFIWRPFKPTWLIKVFYNTCHIRLFTQMLTHWQHWWCLGWGGGGSKVPPAELKQWPIALIVIHRDSRNESRRYGRRYGRLVHRVNTCEHGCKVSPRLRRSANVMSSIFSARSWRLCALQSLKADENVFWDASQKALDPLLTMLGFSRLQPFWQPFGEWFGEVWMQLCWVIRCSKRASNDTPKRKAF